MEPSTLPPNESDQIHVESNNLWGFWKAQAKVNLKKTASAMPLPHLPGGSQFEDIAQQDPLKHTQRARIW